MNSHNQVESTPIRQRMTPTFYHHNIFGYQQQNKPFVRVTPTFQSTVFNLDGYQIQTNHSRTLNIKQQNKDYQAVIYKNQSRERKQAFLYPSSNYGQIYTCKTSRNNDEKERLAEDINQIGGRTSRLRKCVQLMSNPIFGGYLWTPFIIQKGQEKRETDYNPNNYRYQKENSQRKQANLKISYIQNEDQQIKQVKKDQKNPKEQANIKRKQDAKSINKNLKTNDKHKNTLKRFKSAANLAHKHGK